MELILARLCEFYSRTPDELRDKDIDELLRVMGAARTYDNLSQRYRK